MPTQKVTSDKYATVRNIFSNKVIITTTFYVGIPLGMLMVLIHFNFLWYNCFTHFICRISSHEVSQSNLSFPSPPSVGDPWNWWDLASNQWDPASKIDGTWRDLNRGPPMPWSSTYTTRPPRHPYNKNLVLNNLHSNFKNIPKIERIIFFT